MLDSIRIHGTRDDRRERPPPSVHEEVPGPGSELLVRLLVRLRSYGGAVAICGCNDKIREVFGIVMLEDILQVCDSEEEARTRLAKAVG